MLLICKLKQENSLYIWQRQMNKVKIMKTNLISSSTFFKQFGESQKLRLVRILRSTVMVRVGGGWVALDEFLVKNDPCRGMYEISSYFLQ